MHIKNSKPWITQLSNRERIWLNFSPKKTYERSTGAWKDAQHQWSSGKCKLKPQKHHLTSVRMIIIKKTRQDLTSAGVDVEKRRPPCTWWYTVCTGIATMENSMEDPEKKKQNFHTWVPSFPSGNISKCNKNTNSKIYLHHHVHSSIT